MTIFKGMLLFDIAEDSINGWENQLGYRGMMEVWKKGDKTIYIDLDEDTGEWYSWLDNGTDGYNLDFYGTFDEVDKMTKGYMEVN